MSKRTLSIDGENWTEADWRDLHEGVEAIKAKIAKRHEWKQIREVDTRAHKNVLAAHEVLGDALEQWRTAEAKIMRTWLRCAGDWCHEAAREIEGSQ